MNKHSFSGKNLEEALLKAAEFFSVEKPFVSYSVVDQSSKGLLAKLFSKGIQIEAWVETDKEDLKAAARRAVQEAFQKQTQSSLAKTAPISRPIEREKRATISFNDKAARTLFQEYSSHFFSAFQVPTENVSTEFSGNDANVHVKDEFTENLLIKSDKLSVAFEHVFKRIAQKKVGDISGRVTLNAGESAEKREERLIAMARSLAEKVKKTGKSVALSSKSGQERRIIHMALDGLSGVGTKSSGTGDKRRLIIYSTAANAHPKHRRKKPTHERAS